MKELQTITVSRRSSVEERQTALYQIYAQVLERQPYVYERRILAQAEKDFLRDKIGVKRFLKMLGHSEVYLNEFYYGSSNLKFLELCFKHFMGRAFDSHTELNQYCDILMREGVNKLITKLIDSEEYRKHFGCFTVPYPHAEAVYESPRAYLESDLLVNELHGRRGKFLPTMLWRELGLECDRGECQLPSESLSFSDTKDTTQIELLQILRRMRSDELEDAVASMSQDQREILSRVLLQLK